MNQNQFVFPGDVIATGNYRPAQNVTLDGDWLLSTAIGFSEINDDLVTVTPLTGFYSPGTDDLVVGKVISHNALSWEVKINWYFEKRRMAKRWIIKSNTRNTRCSKTECDR